jgi:transcriptional regulator with XRE-family HTH domain
MTFAEKLKKLRKLLDITQHELSKLVKIPQSSISCWETGVTEAREPARLKLEKLSVKKGIKINWRK